MNWMEQKEKKSLETSIGERDWSMARNEMLMVISCYLMVVWATSTQVKREQSLTWMFKYIFIWDISDFRYAIKLITYCLVVLNVFEIDNQLMLFHVSSMIKINTKSICIGYDAINCMSNQALIYVTPTFWYIINFLLFWCIPLLIKPSQIFGFEVSWGKWTFCSQVYHNDYCICKIL